MRSIIYVSGTRADYGLMASSLKLWRDSKLLDVSVCVTGMHLMKAYGCTVQEIKQDDLRLCGQITVDLSNASGAAMAKGIATSLAGMVDIFAQEQPDMVVVLGDRGEMLAGALAAIHLNIPVVHIHGGELSGTIDEPVRHAISKLSHYHFTATAGARQRLIKMGEKAEHIFTVGAPGLDGLMDDAMISRDILCEELGFTVDQPIALLLFHPVIQDAKVAGKQMDIVLEAVRSCGVQLLCLLPNADAGSDVIRQSIEKFQQSCRIKLCVLTHLPRVKFISWMKHVDVMIGNSSSGIIEAATFATPVVNAGSRQQGRERSCNVLDVDVEMGAVREAIASSLEKREGHIVNVYGDGKSGQRMLKLLQRLPLNQSLLNKLNAY